MIVEICWLKALSNEKDVQECRILNEEEELQLNNIINNFDISEAEKVKEIEKTTNHDVKAVEYYLKDKIACTSLDDLSEFIIWLVHLKILIVQHMH